MEKIFILITMLFLTTSLVFSADWYGNDNFGFMIDKSSIVKTKDSIQAWVITVGMGKINNKKYAYKKSYIEAKCSDRTLATLETTFYTQKHKPIALYNFEQNNLVQYNRVAPDTMGEALLNDLCSIR